MFQVSNEVATLTAQTRLIIEKTTPHAPSNVTVTRKETFAVTIEWLPGYSGCSHCDQTYKIRWELPISNNSDVIKLSRPYFLSLRPCCSTASLDI